MDSDIQPGIIKKTIVEILPENKRTRELRAKQQAEQNRIKQEKEKLKRRQEEESQKAQKRQQEEAQQKKKQEEQRKEEERRRQEEQQQINTLKGRFGNIINQLNLDKTPHEITITGLSLLPAQIRILINAAKNNLSVKTLSMTRKNIRDKEGIDIAKCLEMNQNLQRVELEGNNLGPKTAEAFGQLLKHNYYLRIIDLEGNDLMGEEKQIVGIKALAEALKTNTTLLTLNLTNCKLNEQCGAILKEAMMQNKTLINLDIDGNKLDLNDVRSIQDCLKANKLDYDKERFKEFMERKRMIREEEISQSLDTEATAIKIMKEQINHRIQIKKQLMEQEWNKQLLQEEQKKFKDKQKLEKLAKMRTGKKRRRGHMGKKKK